MDEKDFASAELHQEILQRDLNAVMLKAGLDLNTLAKQGCICCDVGAGAEILALNHYQPRILIASEPSDYHSGRGEIETSLAKIKTIAPIELIRGEPTMALKLCAQQQRKVGLVTWLNFFTLARPLLTDGGVAVASVDWIDPNYWGGQEN
ncbi:MAG: hypothetical protein UV54_C0002G0024 [Candidatus Beckwithbacteria bacterium GW2011_GWA2_43_10]|uniref:Uncharacterized protein n=1 Tax=Candidatus Beckwithbacteria bacterium GW2011_GWA2_43_10 TaxID=1618369 RepID=A0A0G1C4Y5_9BACT|nr:MAG: hypothetical protein UV54_C0002G0024 [Candidatus Beckwithbacteria bacterium GW2011_GWA2_43_10]